MAANQVVSPRVRSFFLTLGLGAVVTLAAPRAEACGDDFWPAVQIDHRIQGMRQVEREVGKGHLRQAAASVLRMMPYLPNAKPSKRDPFLAQGLRVLAVATVRAGGTLDFANEVPSELHGTWTQTSREARQKNLAWSVSALRAVSLDKGDDPAVKTELGEALAQVDGGQAEALLLLGSLSDKDLLTSPEGYAALAELRGKAGDQDGRSAALARCKAMASDVALCGAEARSTAS